MSLIIQAPKGIYHQSKDFNLEIENLSPIFNEKGSQSLPGTFPPTRHNLKIVDYIHRLDNINKPNKDVRVTISDGVYQRSGKQNISSISKSAGIVANIGFDESEIYSAWNSVKLRSLKGLPTEDYSKDIDGLIDKLDRVMKGKIVAPYYLFEVKVSNESITEGNNKTYYPEYINNYSEDSIDKFRLIPELKNLSTIENGKLTITSVPKGYGISPFLKVSWLLDFIFSSYGYKLVENPFADHHQLKTMVVLNNVADTIVTGRLSYSDLMPDCTINEFFSSLYARTGMVVFVDGNTRSAKIKFVKDILAASPINDWSLLRSEDLEIQFSEPQQLKLSAKTSLPGAKPIVETFDDFLKLCHGIISPVGILQDYSQDLRIIYERATGRYYKNNPKTRQLEWYSSDFFMYAEKSEDSEYKEISGIDECVPMGFEHHPRHFLCPEYLVGSIHKHTTLVGSVIDSTEEEKEKTPLAFLFTIIPKNVNLTAGYYAFGTSTCYSNTGEQITDNEGHTYELSLTFSGRQGAYNQMFRSFDLHLKNSNNLVVGKLNLSKLQLMNLDLSLPIAVDGQPLLIDKANFSLPYSRSAPATFTFRTIKYLLPCDLSAPREAETQLYKWSEISVEESFDGAVWTHCNMYEMMHGFRPVELKQKRIYSTEPFDIEVFRYLLPPSTQDVLVNEHHLVPRHGETVFWINIGKGYEEKCLITYSCGVEAVLI